MTTGAGRRCEALPFSVRLRSRVALGSDVLGRSVGMLTWYGIRQQAGGLPVRVTTYALGSAHRLHRRFIHHRPGTETEGRNERPVSCWNGSSQACPRSSTWSPQTAQLSATPSVSRLCTGNVYRQRSSWRSRDTCGCSNRPRPGVGSGLRQPAARLRVVARKVWWPRR